MGNLQTRYIKDTKDTRGYRIFLTYRFFTNGKPKKLFYRDNVKVSELGIKRFLGPGSAVTLEDVPYIIYAKEGRDLFLMYHFYPEFPDLVPAPTIEQRKTALGELFISDTKRLTSDTCLHCRKEYSDTVYIGCGHRALCYNCAIFMYQTRPTCIVCSQPSHMLMQLRDYDKEIDKNISNEQT